MALQSDQPLPETLSPISNIVLLINETNIEGWMQAVAGGTSFDHFPKCTLARFSPHSKWQERTINFLRQLRTFNTCQTQREVSSWKTTNFSWEVKEMSPLLWPESGNWAGQNSYIFYCRYHVGYGLLTARTRANSFDCSENVFEIPTNKNYSKIFEDTLVMFGSWVQKKYNKTYNISIVSSLTVQKKTGWQRMNVMMADCLLPVFISGVFSFCKICKW